MATANFNDTVPAAPATKLNVKWQKDGSGNVSAYIPATAAMQTPWLQDIDGAGYNLLNAGAVESRVDKYFCSNAYRDAGGTWRYRANGAAAVLGANADGHTRIYSAANGSAGAAVTWVEAMKFRGDGVVEIPRVINVSNPITWNDANAVKLNLGYNSSVGIETDTVYYRSGGIFHRWYTNGAGPDGGASCAMELTINGLLPRVPIVFPDTGGVKINLGYTANTIGIEPNTVYYRAGGSLQRWYMNGAGPDDGASCSMELTNSYVWFKVAGLKISALPSANPGAGTKQLWYDPADGNRVKYAA